MKGPIFKNTPKSMIPDLESYSSLRLKTRVMCLFYGKDEFKHEIKELRE